MGATTYIAGTVESNSPLLLTGSTRTLELRHISLASAARSVVQLVVHGTLQARSFAS